MLSTIQNKNVLSLTLNQNKIDDLKNIFKGYSTDLVIETSCDPSNYTRVKKKSKSEARVSAVPRIIVKVIIIGIIMTLLSWTFERRRVKKAGGPSRVHLPQRRGLLCTRWKGCGAHRARPQ